MNVVNKKIYYKYFDLYRLSKFLGDNLVAKRAWEIINVLNVYNCLDFNLLDKFSLLELGLSSETIHEIIEYQKSGKILFVDAYKRKVPKWIQDIILQDFFDIDFITSIIRKNNIKNKAHLSEYFRSDNLHSLFEKQVLELYAHFVDESSFDKFPLRYSIYYDDISDIVSCYCNAPILGNFHNHSIYSDGRCSIEEIAKLAQLANRKYVGISDHTKCMCGLVEDNVIDQHLVIDRVKQYSSCDILKGVECEILKKGELDMEDWALKKMDYVIVAVHTNVNMIKKEAEYRLIKAIENEYTSILAHPSSRILNKKVGLFVDMYKIIDACVANKVVIEINGDPLRLDLDPKYIKYALNKGAIFSLDSDTHSYNGFKNINNAIHMAKDCHIPSERILNTFEIARVKDVFLKN